VNLNLPNRITLGRLLLAVVFFILVSFDGQAVLNWALAIFVIACLTDFLDGYFARKYNMVTALGRIADPFVDKVIVCGGFVLLVGRSPYIAAWMVVVIISREFLVSSIRGYAESEGVEFGAEMAGKIKAAWQMVAVAFVIAMKANGHLFGLPWPETLTWIGVYGSVVLSILSAATYCVKAKKLFAPQPPETDATADAE
jgi:CDP-diacylglycerol---glycerol-3-phosphate 3-phosphatidyltransferase